MGGFTVKFDDATAPAPLQDEGNRDTDDPGMYSYPNQHPQNQVTHRRDRASSIPSRLSRWIGPIDWKEDEINSSSAETALLESSIASYDPGYRDSVKSLKADIWVLDGKQLYQAWEYGIRSFPQSQRAIYPTETKATLL
ncbi:hypothetical protein N7509_005879 [Penicillium cosmopolitanum]|uniref:Uncharacterized protein n=1 Tax=Penicillium cosmopolitanum TaxID=1131564 RepID=A0A9W9W3I2_9EURO|nr:uncharacterized protein N7509_005879 [Penicillium cosmopolitanum]KAJ5397766.1 hypothetical protein N7509_005879 [Penicillium cosmopolitanum]